jgi:type VI secretion system protein ImpJ
MFLRPQHLQVAARNLSGMVEEAVRNVLPFSWGFVDVDIDEDQLGAFCFALRRCEAIFKDGVRASIPASLTVDRREFKEQLDRSDGNLPVYLGVAALKPGDRNTQPQGERDSGGEFRYTVEVIECADENAGGPTQQIEIRKLKGRLFFGNENREGYDCLPLALIRRAGHGSNAPEIAGEFIPPVVVVSAWPSLMKLCEKILHGVEARHQSLRAEVSSGRINLGVENAQGWQPILKLQIIGAFVHLLRQLVIARGIHPFHLYIEMARLAGELSIFEETGADAVNIPPYDHDNLGECFYKTVYSIERLLEKILSGSFIKVQFEIERDILVAKLEEHWLVSGSELYLCIESDLDDKTISSRIERVKVGAPEDLPILRQRRLFGLDITPLNRIPGGLPAREAFHYFAINKQGSYWENVVQSVEMAISGGIDKQLSFSLYIILHPEPAPS